MPNAGRVNWGGAQAKVPKNQDARIGDGEVPGKMLNLDARFGHVKNRIAKVGIEVEGGWTVLPEGVKQANHDGSVFKAGLPPGCPLLVTKGELASPPIEPALLGSWTRKHHPQVVDPSCGLHMHIGVKKAEYYNLLMDSPDYQATIVGYLRKWATENAIPKDHCLWERLTGNNRYCRNLFWPELQAIKSGKEHDVERDGNKKGHRYTIVNYCWGLGFETLEIRVLPMMPTPALSVSALRKLVDVTNAYLAEVAPKNLEGRRGLKFKAGLTLDADEAAVQKKRVIYV